jgi:hypothetical protein
MMLPCHVNILVQVVKKIALKAFSVFQAHHAKQVGHFFVEQVGKKHQLVAPYHVQMA